MSRLVCDDADHLIGVLGLHQSAGVDEHVMSVEDEGVEVEIVDDVNFDGLRAETGDLKDRLGLAEVNVSYDRGLWLAT